MLGFSFLLGGCATGTTTRTGFLSDYSQLKSDPKKPQELVYRRAEWRPADFTQVLIEPTTVRLSVKDQKKVNAREAEKLAGYCDTVLRKKLGLDRAVTSEPDAKTLRVRAAITGLDTSSPAINVISTVVLWPVDYGGVSLEFEVVDASTNEQQAALIGFSNGTPLQVIGSFSRLGHARSGIDHWVGELGRLIKPPK